MAEESQTGWRSSSAALAEDFDLLLLDLDGVVYVGPDVVPGAAQSLDRAVAAGLTCRFVTNNAGRPPGVVAAHLRELGIDARDDDVVTSAQEGAELLATQLPAASPVLAVGGPGVAIALEEAGLRPVTRFDATVVGVLQGYGPDVNWRDLAEVTYAVQAGVTWVATNSDLTVPTPRGTAPGNGQLTAVVERTTGVSPTVTGKPGPGLFTAAVRRAGGGRALVIGDRLDTDIAGAVAAGLPSMLVLTGLSGAGELLAAGPGERPTYLGADLEALWLTHPGVRREGDWWVCGDARARLDAGQVEISGVGGLESFRVTAAASWWAQDNGVRIDLTSVKERLQSAAR